MVDLQGETGQFEALGVQVLAIMTDSLGLLRESADENAISAIPLLSDADSSVSRAYDTLGRGMHADRPGHTFILVGREGDILWRKDYSEMYVPVEDIVSAVRRALEG